jgi:hypothetical protein
MTSLEQATDLIGRLTRGEKARLVKAIVSQLDESFPGIDDREGVSRPGIGQNAAALHVVV